MKTIKNISYITLFLFLQIAFASVAFADEEFTKKYHEEYDTDKSTVLEVHNKYGEVNIKNWENNQIVIDVTVTVEADDKEEAEKYMKQIKIKIDKSGNKIEAVTDLDGSFNNVDFTIDYEIKMPTATPLTLSNKYGAIFINELSNFVDIAVKYGSLQINTLTNGKTDPKSKIDLGYSKGSIGKCNWLKIGLAYSKLSINEATALIVVSKYSGLEVEESSTIVAESKYDKDYEIGKVNNFVCEGKYSRYDIEEVASTLKLDIGYSKVSVDYIPQNFELIKIESKYGSIDLDIDENAEYKLKASLKYGSIDYPESEKISVQKENTSVEVWGDVGQNPKGEVFIQSKYGNVDIE